MSNGYQHNGGRSSGFRENGYAPDDDQIMDPREMNDIATDAFAKSANALNKAELGATEKRWGLELDSGIASYIDSFVNIGTDVLNKRIAPDVERITRSLGKQAGMSEHGNALNRTAAVTTFGVAAALKSASYLTPVYQAFKEPHVEQKQLARKLAPVLNDIKGKHSAGALNSVSETDNEVIFAHRKRMAKIAQSKKLGALIGLGLNAGANVLINDVKRFGQMWGGKTGKEADTVLQAKAAEADAKAKESANAGDLKMMLTNAATLSAGPIAQRVKLSNEFKLKKTLQPYSALQMILELEDQVAANPKATSFSVPKSFQAPKERLKSYPLEEYVMRIFIQHQVEMADITDDHTEIREALKQDLAAVAKPIAAAIRKGDMSAMDLIRLVGERKVVKNHGRAIVSPEEVETLIKRDTPKGPAQIHNDPKNDFKGAYTRDELKAALKGLEGNERRDFIKVALAVLSDSALREAGVSEAEMKAVRAAATPEDAKKYDRLLADLLVGIKLRTEKDPKEIALASSEQKELASDYQKIEARGVDAIHDLKVSPVNTNGVEHLLATATVSKIKGDRTYFGTLLKEGHAKIEAMESEASDNKESFDSEKPIKGHHTAREHLRSSSGNHYTVDLN